MTVACATATLRADDTPTAFVDCTVHDPSVVRDGDTYWVFGSHMASASTSDFIVWSQYSTSADSPNLLVVGSAPRVEFADALAYAEADTFWAPDAVRLGDGNYYYYYCACEGSMPLAVLGLAKAAAVNGPYEDVGILLRSMGASPTVSPYNATIHPNVVDPAVFYDHEGQLWMVYGSYSGGIFILQLDADPDSSMLGQPLSGLGYGTKLMGGYHAQIEGSYIVYSPETGYYYLFVSFGGLAASGGYNMRVFRSENPDGPYVDPMGNDMSTVSITNNLWSTIQPYGVKLMGGCRFIQQTGEPGTTPVGYVSPGHNSVYRDPDTGKYVLVFHSRFTGTGEVHNVRAHQMFMNADGWFVAAPHRYVGETMEPTSVARIVGSYKMINHAHDITPVSKTSTNIVLAVDGTVTGTSTGTWSLSGDNEATLVLGGVTYEGVFVRQWNDATQSWVMAFTALSNEGVCVWGSKFVVDLAPAFVVQPQTQTAQYGAPVTLTAEASGEPEPGYQWRKGGVNIDGATSATFTIDAATWDDAGAYTVVATNDGGTVTSQTATLTLTKGTGLIELQDLSQAYTGSALSPTVVTTPAGLAVEMTFDGSSTPPTNPGSYALVVMIDDSSYEGSASDTFVIEKAAGSVVLDDLIHTYTGAPLSPTVTTTPAGMDVVLTFNGSSTVPTAAGSYTVAATIDDTFYQGSATATMEIRPVVELGQTGPIAATAGGAFTLTSSSTGTSTPTYQWQIRRDSEGDWVDVSGAMGDTLNIPSAQHFHEGEYRVVVSAGGASTVSDTVTVSVAAAADSDARLMNLSTRALCLTGNDVLIPGFVIQGTGTKSLLIRAVGPELSRFGIASPLPDPQMRLKQKVGSSYVDYDTNDNWGENANADDIAQAADSISAFSLDTGSLSAALLLDLPVGEYTVVSSDTGTGTGIGIVELYDMDEASSGTRLVNISNRGYVGTGNDIMIPGFVVSDEGSRTFLIRAVGPTLTRFSVTGVLTDPQLRVFSGSTPILSSDNWGEYGDASYTAQVASQLYAFSLDEGSADAAFVVTLPPGAYTVLASGVGGTTGVALLEIYLVP